jgi:hypothetical protein
MRRGAKSARSFLDNARPADAELSRTFPARVVRGAGTRRRPARIAPGATNMKLRAFEAVAQAFRDAQVRYLVAGGLAVNAHGYLRFTADIDVVIALDADNVLRTFGALSKVGYRPTVPITAEQFADANQRQRWIAEKGMQVLNFFSDQHPESSVDIFVYEPFDFHQEFTAAMVGEVLPGLSVRFVSIPTLIHMKEAAGRARDLDDIQHLRWILEDESEK